MNLEAVFFLQAVIISGYTIWKWYTEWQDRKEKKRLTGTGQPTKQEPET